MSKEFYDRLFASGQHKAWNDAPGKKVLIAWLANKCSVASPSILDIGCGNGYFGNILSKTLGARTCHCCDISPIAIEEGRRLYPELEFEVCDATRLPYESNSFDVITSYGVIEHVQTPSKAIHEAARVLTKGGLLAFMMPTIGHYRQDRSDEGWYEDLNTPPQLQWNLTRLSWEKIFYNAGLILISENEAEKFGAIHPGNFYFGSKEA